MLIQWIAHACFKITAADGTSVIIDPFDGSVGYRAVELTADAVLSSHDHFDHNCFAAVSGDFMRIAGPGKYTAGSIAVEGIAAFHDAKGGAERGTNTVYKLTVDGVEIVHLGDLGHIPSEEQYGKIGSVDVLLIPVGGFFTIGPKEAMEIIERVRPNIILPMHYSTREVKWDIAPLDDFIALAKDHYDISRTGRDSVEVIKRDLKKRTRIFILDHLA